MPIRKEEARKKLAGDVKKYLESGGEITKLKITDRAEPEILTVSDRAYIDSPTYLSGV